MCFFNLDLKMVIDQQIDFWFVLCVFILIFIKKINNHLNKKINDMCNCKLISKGKKKKKKKEKRKKY